MYILKSYNLLIDFTKKKKIKRYTIIHIADKTERPKYEFIYWAWIVGSSAPYRDIV